LSCLLVGNGPQRRNILGCREGQIPRRLVSRVAAGVLNERLPVGTVPVEEAVERLLVGNAFEAETLRTATQPTHGLGVVEVVFGREVGVVVAASADGLD